MRNKLTIIIVLVLMTVIGIFIFNRSETTTSKPNKEENTIDNLTPVDSITHGHGLSVDVADSSKVYIATHHGLYVLTDEKDLYRIGDSEDDYMGFSPHPKNSKVFYTSGHPKFGGNLGVQMSVDGGLTWEKISNGVNGPVDFHAMTISPVNPNVMYGWHGGLQRSLDGGKNWEAVSTNLSEVLSLVAGSQDESTVFAATTQGLLVSEDKGEQWAVFSPDLVGNVIAAFAVHPADSQKMLVFSPTLNLVKSNDRGATWEKLNETFGGGIVLYIAYSKTNPEIVYALTDANVIYKSEDNGTTWSKIY